MRIVNTPQRSTLLALEHGQGVFPSSRSFRWSPWIPAESATFTHQAERRPSTGIGIFSNWRLQRRLQCLQRRIRPPASLSLCLSLQFYPDVLILWPSFPSSGGSPDICKWRLPDVWISANWGSGSSAKLYLQMEILAVLQMEASRVSFQILYMQQNCQSYKLQMELFQ